MTAMLGQLLTRALPAAVISSMGGSGANKWQTLLSQATAAGYGIGEVIDFLQDPENAKTKSARQNIERRDSRGIASTSEIANKPEQPARPGEQLKRLSLGIGGPLAALQTLTGRVGDNSPPPPNPNAIPQNAANGLSQAMKKRPKPRGLMEQSEQRPEKRLDEIAPSLYESARSLMEKGTPLDSIAASLTAGARKDKKLARDMRSVRAMFPGVDLTEVIKNQVTSSPIYDDLDSDDIALKNEIEKLLQKLEG